MAVLNRSTCLLVFQAHLNNTPGSEKVCDCVTVPDKQPRLFYRRAVPVNRCGCVVAGMCR